MEFNNKLKPKKSNEESELKETMEKEYKSGQTRQNNKWMMARKRMTELYRQNNPNWDGGKKSFEEAAKKKEGKK
jgi:hypothetical protein